MTTISLGQPARPSRFGMRAFTAAINGGRLSRDSGRYLVDAVQLREQFEMGNVTSRPQEFAGGFIDFPWAGALATRDDTASPSRIDARNARSGAGVGANETSERHPLMSAR